MSCRDPRLWCWLKSLPWRRIVGVAVCALVLWLSPLGFFLDPSPNNKITRSNSDRIHVGMAKAAVEVILGPPGNHCQPPLLVDRHPPKGAPKEVPPEQWLGRH